MSSAWLQKWFLRLLSQGNGLLGLGVAGVLARLSSHINSACCKRSSWFCRATALMNSWFHMVVFCRTNVVLCRVGIAHRFCQPLSAFLSTQTSTLFPMEFLVGARRTQSLASLQRKGTRSWERRTREKNLLLVPCPMSLVPLSFTSRQFKPGEYSG